MSCLPPQKTSRNSYFSSSTVSWLALFFSNLIVKIGNIWSRWKGKIAVNTSSSFRHCHLSHFCAIWTPAKGIFVQPIPTVIKKTSVSNILKIISFRAVQQCHFSVQTPPALITDQIISYKMISYPKKSYHIIYIISYHMRCCNIIFVLCQPPFLGCPTPKSRLAVWFLPNIANILQSTFTLSFKYNPSCKPIKHWTLPKLGLSVFN